MPGAAIAVVQGGRVVYERGFGVREVGQPDPVTPDTLFMIGSISKPLTSLMMAALVDRGRLRWDTPVVELLPSFALGDAEATRKLTVQHTVCACTGLPRQDMELFFGYSRATPESRVAELRDMVPTTGFGETFQYSNPLVSAGGFIAARAYAPELPLGAAYDCSMRELVFDPLGMTRTTTDFAVVARTNHARPHATRGTLTGHGARIVARGMASLAGRPLDLYGPGRHQCSGRWSTGSTFTTVRRAPERAAATDPPRDQEDAMAKETTGKTFEVVKSDAEWRALLTPEQYRVLREHGTEGAGTNPLDKECGPGAFLCAGCDLPLFSSETKFDSGTGWPSFWAPLDGAVGTSRDRSFFMVRTEVHCRRCGGHLGHVFDDGPAPTGLRYCMNGAALSFARD